jgi:hypothetical protein
VPEFLPDPCNRRTVSNEEFLRFGAVLADTLLVHAGASPERWAELLKARYALEGICPSFFDALEQSVARGELLDPEQHLWGDIRRALHQAYYRRPDPSDAQLARIQRLYDALTPSNPVRAVTWLFTPPTQVPEHFPNGWQEQVTRLEDLRRAALARLYADDLTLLRELSALVSQPVELGVVLARMPFASKLEPTVLDLESDDWARVRPGFFAVLALDRGLEWAGTYLRGLLAHDRLSEAAESARTLPWNPSIWDLIEQVSPVLRTTYWRSLDPLYPQAKGDAERFVTELMAVGAYAQAFDVAGHFAENLSSELLLHLLDALSRDPDELKLTGAAAWEAQQIFDRLNGDASLEDDALVGLELRYLPWLEEPFGATGELRIFRTLERQPEFFAQLVGLMYRAEAEPDADGTEEAPESDGAELSDAQKQAAAQNAYAVLEAWDGYPGKNAEAGERAQRQTEWSTAVLTLTAESGRVEPGEALLAKVLARVPAGSDGVWPCEAARALIEQGRLRFRDELEVEKKNLRGITSKGIFEGGRQEQSIAGPYREGAASLRLTCPETAAFLDRIAASYEEDAREEDTSARDGRIEAGVDEDEP